MHVCVENTHIYNQWSLINNAIIRTSTVMTEIVTILCSILQCFHVTFWYRFSLLGIAMELIPKIISDTRYYPQLRPYGKAKRRVVDTMQWEGGDIYTFFYVMLCFKLCYKSKLTKFLKHPFTTQKQHKVSSKIKLHHTENDTKRNPFTDCVFSYCCVTTSIYF